MKGAGVEKKKRHHFVWRKYLKPWATNGFLPCLMKDGIFTSGLRNLGQEKHFYRLKRLGRSEVWLLYEFVKKARSDHLWDLNKTWIEFFESLTEGVTRLEDGNLSDSEVGEVVELACSNFEEEMQGWIERKGGEILRQSIQR